jgi:response regulator NasT
MPALALQTVLTVEDDPIVRADVRLILEVAGFSVCTEARDGVEAVKLARELEPDLVLMDLGLPNLDGVEATRQIRDHRDVPVVALTGYSGRHLLERAREAGAVDHVLKPFSERQLVASVRGALSDRAEREAEHNHLRAMIERMQCDGYSSNEIEYAVLRAASWTTTRTRARGLLARIRAALR